MAEGTVSSQFDSVHRLAQWRVSALRGILARWSIPAMMSVHLLLTVFIAWKANLWVDEAYTLHTTSRTLSFAVSSSLWFEMQPPVYFVLLWFFRQLGSSIFVARCFSILCSLVTLLVVATLSKRLLPKVHPAWAVSVFALNPFLIWAATEIRLYALMILLSGGLILIFHEGFFTERCSKAPRWGYAGLALIALYTQYYLGFLIFAQGLTLLVLRDWPGVKRYVLLMSGVAVLFLPMCYAVLLQVQSRVESPEVESNLIRDIAGVVYNIRGYAFPVTYDWTAWMGKIFWAVLLLVGGLAAMRWRDRLMNRTLVMLGISVAVPFGLYTGLVWKIGPGSAELRHTSLLMIPMVFLVLGFLHAVSSPRFLGIAAGVLLATQLAGLHVRHTEQWAKPGDWIQVASFLHSEVSDDEPIVMYTPEWAIALKPYYHGESPLVPLPEAEACEVYDVSKYVLESPSQVDFLLREKLGDLPERMWLIETGGEEYMGVVYHREYLHQFLERHYREQREEIFYRCRIRYFQRTFESE